MPVVVWEGHAGVFMLFGPPPWLGEDAGPECYTKQYEIEAYHHRGHEAWHLWRRLVVPLASVAQSQTDFIGLARQHSQKRWGLASCSRHVNTDEKPLEMVAKIIK